MRVLIVDDDPKIAELLWRNLTARGHQAETAHTGKEALRTFQTARWDAVLLDLLLPDLDGLEVLKFMRRDAMVPIVIISAVGEEATKVAALDLGADDYLTKPFGIPELLARLRAVARRYGAPQEKRSVGELWILPGGLVRVRDREIHLTPTEHALLSVLLEHPGAVVEHAELLDRVWGRGAGDLHYLHVYVNRLRKKLSGYLRIEAVPGHGYRALRTF